MPGWIADYWIAWLVVLLLGALAAWRLWARRQPPPVRRGPDAAPLQPVKPDIVAAEPARFAPREAAPAAPPPPPDGDRPRIAAAVGPADNLLLLKGVGPKLAGLLTGLGVVRFDQIAAWGEAEIAEVDRFLGAFQGRIKRDNWVDQAGYLARGDTAGFEAKYGALGGGG